MTTFCGLPCHVMYPVADGWLRIMVLTTTPYYVFARESEIHVDQT